MEKWVGAFALAPLIGCQAEPSSQVELVRDRWGVPHVFAADEAAGFFGVGWMAGEDRLLQMDLLRRRARGQLAAVLGSSLLDSDRRFRVARIGQYCDEAAAALPAEDRRNLEAYAAGVNTFAARYDSGVGRRFARLGVKPGAWTGGDSICAWIGATEVFDPLFDEGAVTAYQDLQQQIAAYGEAEALAARGMMLDDAAAVVSEAEMARDAPAYARLKARAPTAGFWFRSLPDDQLRFSHAWAVGGARSVSGRPLLESDPQVEVSNPPFWHEFHLSAGRYDVRGIAVPGSPGMLIGWNRQIAWGASALGASSTVTFVEKLSRDGSGYTFEGQTLAFERRSETIEVKGGAAFVQEALRTRHGVVFDPFVRTRRAGESYVSHSRQVEERRTSVEGLLAMMRATGWSEFRQGMERYYSPGLHIVYADTAGNLGYQTLVHAPLTRSTPRVAIEGWTAVNEIRERIPLDELPHMLNPASGFVSHANNLSVGSWYPHDLGIGTGGTGHTSRSLRLIQLLTPTGRYTADSFEATVHRDDVHSAVASLLPPARRVAAESGVREPALTSLLDALAGWDLRYRADRSTYTAANALAGALITPYRGSALNARLGGGEGGITHLARLVEAQFGPTGGTPTDPDVRAYLLSWLRAAAQAYQQQSGTRPTDGQSREVHRMPYQKNGPLQFPALDPSLEVLSPPLSCGQVGTIWSQLGNSYTQIVDLADVDASRSLLPPGLSEDPESPHHEDQIDLWVRGTTHPAPLSKARVLEVAVARRTLHVDLGSRQ